MRFMRGFVVVMALLVAGGGAAQTADAPSPPRELRDVKVEQRATAAAVTVATSGQPKYETTRLDSPVHLMIDISRTVAPARRIDAFTAAARWGFRLSNTTTSPGWSSGVST